MADNKESFLLYRDLIHTVRKLSKEKAGELFLHILQYVNDENPVTEDPLLDIVFEPIKQQLKRDLRKYEKVVLRNQKNGSLGGRPKKDNPKNPVGLNETQKTQTNPLEPRKADSDTVSDTVSDSDTVSGILLKKETKVSNDHKLVLFDSWWQLYNKKTDKEKAIKAWVKLSMDEVNKCLEVVTNYIKSTPDPKYRKNPLTYLNGKCWQDEIEIKPQANGTIEPTQPNRAQQQLDNAGARLRARIEELANQQGDLNNNHGNQFNVD
jgi:hypothetical protein